MVKGSLSRREERARLAWESLLLISIEMGSWIFILRIFKGNPSVSISRMRPVFVIANQLGLGAVSLPVLGFASGVDYDNSGSIDLLVTNGMWMITCRCKERFSSYRNYLQIKAITLKLFLFKMSRDIVHGACRKSDGKGGF